MEKMTEKELTAFQNGFILGYGYQKLCDCAREFIKVVNRFNWTEIIAEIERRKKNLEIK